MLRLGVVTVDITPERPLPLAGFAHRHSVFESIDRPLFAKVWLFENGGAAGLEPERALVVQADLIWWGSERVTKLALAIRERWGLPESSVILHASHTHFGPQTSCLFTPSLGLPDVRYIRLLETKLMDGIAEAFGRLEPVTIERGSGECNIGIHRRRRKGVKMTMAPNPEGPSDPEVVVIRFRASSGKVAGVWFHYACHPTTTGDNSVTSEFPGVAMEIVERAIGEGAAASFLQGCCGDIRPALIRDAQFYRGDTTDIVELGRTLADEVIHVLQSPMEVLPCSSIRSERLTIALPFQRMPGIEDLQNEAARGGISGEWSRLLLSYPERLLPSIPLELSCLNLAQGLSLLAINAETVVEYGLFAKSLAGGVLPLPYSNGMIGYLPTESQLREGGYESEESGYYFGLPSPFAHSVEQLVKGGAALLLQRGISQL